MIAISLTIIDSNNDYRVKTAYLNEGESISIGRKAETNDVAVNETFVSQHHGVITCIDGKCYYRDINQSNGSYVNSFNHEERLHITDKDVLLSDGSTIRIGHPTHTIRQVLIVFSYGNDETVPEWMTVGEAPISIGRSRTCNIQLPAPNVSRHHCTVYTENGRAFIRDDRSRHGIMVNGEKINGAVALKDKDIIQILGNRLIFSGGRIYYSKSRRGISISARNINKWVGSGKNQKQILQSVNVDIQGGEFVAIVGGSGAGKSTLMGVLNCFDRNFQGGVYCNNISMKENFNSLKGTIGYVPQEDIIYENLTLERMLIYTAKLRLPGDFDKTEIKARVEKVMNMLDLTDHRNTLIRKMSGGQKKRASIAVEVLADPKLFFLDEPTSGLDPGIEKSLMQSLRDLSRKQECTIVTVTHTTQSLHLCDKVIFMGTGGVVCFCGNVDDAKSFFGTDDITEIYQMMSAEPMKWANKFASIKGSNKLPQASSAAGKKKNGSSLGTVFSQLLTTVMRYGEIMVNDWKRLMLLLVQPLIIGLLLVMVAGDDVFGTYGDTKSMIFALSCAAIWLGIFNTIQEVCKERTILKREHMAGLSLTVYVLSKLLVQLVTGLIQAIILVAVFILALGSPAERLWLSSPDLEIFITVFLTIIASELLGLIVSACVRSGDKAMAVAPFILIVQLLFSGILFELSGGGNYLSDVTVSKWSVGALGSIANLNNLEGNINDPDSMFENTADQMFFDWKIMLLMGAVSIVICIVILKRVARDGR